MCHVVRAGPFVCLPCKGEGFCTCDCGDRHPCSQCQGTGRLPCDSPACPFSAQFELSDGSRLCSLHTSSAARVEAA